MKQGTNDISLNVGSAEIGKAYLGAVQVYSTTPVPYDARVEYLASNAQAYIDTGISGGNDELEIACEFVFTTFVAYGGIYGNYVSDNDNSSRLILNGTSGSGIVCNNTKSTTTGNTIISISSNVNYKIVANKSKVLVNNSVVNVTNTTKGTNNNGNIALFNRSMTNPNTSRNIGLQIKSFSIKDNGVLVRDMIPVRVGQVGYMYDKVSGQLFGNVGTGDFTYGNDV